MLLLEIRAVFPAATNSSSRSVLTAVLTSGDGAWPLGGSTWQSVQRGAGSVEIDYLAGEIVLLGRLHRIPTPVNELLQRVVSELARDRGAARSLDAADLLARLP